MLSKYLLYITLLYRTLYAEVITENPYEKWEKNNKNTPQIGFHAGLYRDIYLLKNTMQSVQDQIFKFNDLYMTRFDHKLTSLLTNIAFLDGNLKNIQDKARSWDMLQHHISAWNEQMKSLDRKVDIISSGQEKMLLIDGKLGFLLNLEYNSQRTLNKLTSLEDRMDSLEKSLKDKNTRSSTIYDEFAARGVLSTLKTLEQKFDKSNTLLSQITSNKRGIVVQNHYNGTDGNRIGKGKFFVTCTTSPDVEELIKDMSSKVDLVYDKIIDDNTNEDDDADKLNGSYIVENENSDEIYQSDEEEFSKKANKKGVRKLLKSLCPSNKKLNIILEKLESNQDLVENLTEVLMVKNEDKCSSNLENRFESIGYNVENIMVILNDTNKRLDKVLNMQQQLDVLCNNISSCCQNSKNLDGVELTTQYESTVYNGDETASYTSYQDVDYTTESSFIDEMEHFTTENTNMETEYDDYFTDEYYVDITDLSSDIMKRLSKSNQWMDLCRNPGSERYCDDEGYLAIQSRIDGSVNFSRSWNDYKWGFGSLDSGNFWIGNEAIHQLTRKKNTESNVVLKVELEDFEGNTAYANYETFNVAGEDEFYKLTIGGYFGNASDSFIYHDGAKFSTYDVTNDDAPSCCPCSNSYGGGWWFKSCFESNLNGVYFDVPTKNDSKGIIWEYWQGDSVLAKTRMSVKIKMKWNHKEPSTKDP